MKVKKILFVAASTFLLAACFESGMSAGSLPKGGTPATAQSTVLAIGNAYDSLMDLDSFEANFDLKKAHVDLKLGQTFEAPASKQGGILGNRMVEEVDGFGIIQADASMKAKFAVTGLTSTSVDDVEAEASISDLGIDLYVGTEIGTEVTPEVDFDFSGVDVAAYISTGNLYVNASDNELRSMISEILVATGTPEEEVGQTMENIPEKFYQPGVINADALPLLDTFFNQVLGIETPPTKEDVMTGLGEVLNESSFATLADYITLLDYEDGSFGISVDLSKEDVLSLLTLVLSSNGDQMTEEQIQTAVTEYGKMFEIGALKATILLNSDALLTDVLFDIDVSVDTSKSELYTQSEETPILLDLAYKSALTFKYGDNVSVNLPTDLSSYAVLAN
ncbi:MAG TPA: hypothetical protein PLR04_00740 [Bacilli bacterium]|nr:hypothetical protein [Bacilli bacterium]